VTRISVPSGLAVEAGVYDVDAGALDGNWHATSEAGNRVDLVPIWDELREAVGVEINCPRHPDDWWPTAGRDLPLTELRSWRCPMCAWAFRESLKGRGGTPQF
jgi:hypothetical protein